MALAVELHHLEVVLGVSSSRPPPRLVLPHVRVFLQVGTLLFQTKCSFFKLQVWGSLMVINYMVS